MEILMSSLRGAQKSGGRVKSEKLEISFDYLEKMSNIRIKIGIKIVKTPCIFCHSVIDCRRSVEMNRE